MNETNLLDVPDDSHLSTGNFLLYSINLWHILRLIGHSFLYYSPSKDRKCTQCIQDRSVVSDSSPVSVSINVLLYLSAPWQDQAASHTHLLFKMFQTFDFSLMRASTKAASLQSNYQKKDTNPIKAPLNPIPLTAIATLHVLLLALPVPPSTPPLELNLLLTSLKSSLRALLPLTSQSSRPPLPSRTVCLFGHFYAVSSRH